MQTLEPRWAKESSSFIEKQLQNGQSDGSLGVPQSNDLGRDIWWGWLWREKKLPLEQGSVWIMADLDIGEKDTLEN